MLGFAKRRLMIQKRPWCYTMKTFIFSSQSTQKVILLTQRSLKCSLVGSLQWRNRQTMVELMRLGRRRSLQLGGASNTSPRTVISSPEYLLSRGGRGRRVSEEEEVDLCSESWATAVDESPCCLGSQACLHSSSRGWAGYILSDNGTGTLAFYSLIKNPHVHMLLSLECFLLKNLILM